MTHSLYSFFSSRVVRKHITWHTPSMAALLEQKLGIFLSESLKKLNRSGEYALHTLSFDLTGFLLLTSQTNISKLNVQSTAVNSSFQRYMSLVKSYEEFTILILKQIYCSTEFLVYLAFYSQTTLIDILHESTNNLSNEQLKVRV